MSHLFYVALALSVLTAQGQNLPDAFYTLPEGVREKATVIVTGTYAQGRSPCEFMPDGSRRWTLEAWFQIKKVYRGRVGGKSIYIKRSMPPKVEDVGVGLEPGRQYLVLLRPSEESMKAIKAGEYVPAWDALRDEEIVAVVKLK